MKKNVLKKRMTLVELLIVLSIMAMVASLALTGADEMMEQARADETLRRGNAVVETVNGPGERASRFIADMGRLPRVISMADGKITSELWSTNTVNSAVKWDNISFSNTASSWPDTGTEWNHLPGNISVPCGWRGPYMNISKNGLYDGYGNEWEINVGSWSSPIWKNNTEVSLNDVFYGLRSLGRNYVEGGTEWFDADREFNFSEGAVSALLTVNIKYLDTATAPDTPHNIQASFMDRVRVALFVPYVRQTDKCVKRILTERNGSAGSVESINILPSAFPGYGHTETAIWEDYHNVTFTGLTPGLRKLYVYGYLNPSSNKFASGIIPVDLKPGSNLVTVYLTVNL